MFMGQILASPELKYKVCDVREQILFTFSSYKEPYIYQVFNK